MRLYADTSFLIAVIRGNPEALKVAVEEGGILIVPAIAYYEFYVGIRKAEIRKSKVFQNERAFIESLTIEFPDRAVLQRAADLRAKCEAKGIYASDADYMVAAHAAEASGAVITADKDIERIVLVTGLNLKVIRI